MSSEKSERRLHAGGIPVNEEEAIFGKQVLILELTRLCVSLGRGPCDIAALPNNAIFRPIAFQELQHLDSTSLLSFADEVKRRGQDYTIPSNGDP